MNATRISLRKAPRTLPWRTEVEFVNAHDDAGIWERGELAGYSATGNAWIRPAVGSGGMAVALPTEVRPYR